MKLNSNGPLARFYEWSYTDSLPNNLCAYFWKLVTAIVFLPLTWASFWIRDHNVPFLIRIMGGAASQAGIGLLLTIFISPFYGNWQPLIYFGAFVGGVVVVALVITFLETGHSIVPKAASDLAALSYERGKALKENYCPHIQWSSNDNE